MTDNEIMNNVRCCADHYCKGCSLQGKPNCKETLFSFAWNTMYNQQAEIEKLHPYKLHYGNLRMEIAREFADRVKDYLKEHAWIWCSEVDNLLKEMEKE